MTRTEQAAFRRLDKRRHELYVALAIIDTWLKCGFGKLGAEELLMRIADHVTGAIKTEEWEARKESKRDGGWKDGYKP